MDKPLPKPANPAKQIDRPGYRGEAGEAACFSARVGSLAGTDRVGHPLVRIGDNEPVAARVVASLGERIIKEKHRGRDVLLVFEKGDPELPVIVDFIADRFETLVDFENAQSGLAPETQAFVDGKRVVLEGEEVVLRCGAASITLKLDGRIILKGTQITSRASEVNKIKGAAVRIN